MDIFFLTGSIVFVLGVLYIQQKKQKIELENEKNYYIDMHRSIQREIESLSLEDVSHDARKAIYSQMKVYTQKDSHIEPESFDKYIREFCVGDKTLRKIA